MNWKIGQKYKLRGGGYATVVAVVPEANENCRLLTLSGTGSIRHHEINGQYHSARPHSSDILPEEYEEPKPKVMRAQYIFKPGACPPLTSAWYKDEDELKRWHGSNIEIIERLSERPFDV